MVLLLAPSWLSFSSSESSNEELSPFAGQQLLNAEGDDPVAGAGPLGLVISIAAAAVVPFCEVADPTLPSTRISLLSMLILRASMICDECFHQVHYLSFNVVTRSTHLIDVA
uniref:Putative secreted protein n=1 Tax=Anopheles triannulatus TaxID=58253 RepID=A0A2M4B1L6_9DIPT